MHSTPSVSRIRDFRSAPRRALPVGRYPRCEQTGSNLSFRFRPSLHASFGPFAGRVSRRQLLPARFMRLLRPLLTSRFPTSRLPDTLRHPNGTFKPASRESEISPDKNTNFHHADAPFTLRPKPEGFATLGSLAPDARPSMAFLFIASWLSLWLPSHEASRFRS
jgi:hypothetical protein